MDRQQLAAAFQKTYGAEATDFFFSPSRINLIGEHIDYNGGHVLPAAIGMGTYAAVRPNAEGLLRLASANQEEVYSYKFQDLPDYSPELGWSAYVIGVIKALERRGIQTGPVDIYVAGNIPVASGLSSSASLELLVSVIMDGLYNGGQADPIQRVLAGQDCENHYMGLLTGIMDQFAIGMGRQERAMHLDCASLDYRYVPLELGGETLLVINSRKPRRLVESKYNERVGECREILARLQERWRDLQHICELGMGRLEEGLALFAGEDKLQRRLRHCVTEEARVAEALEVLEARDWVGLGRLLRASHASLRDDYEVSGAEMDSIAARANASAACYGARMCGAGFGGCAIALLRAGTDVEAFCTDLLRAYQEDTGLEGEAFPVTAAQGAGRY